MIDDVGAAAGGARMTDVQKWQMTYALRLLVANHDISSKLSKTLKNAIKCIKFL